MTVLTSDADAIRSGHHSARYEGEGREYQYVGVRFGFGDPLRDGANFCEGLTHTVHFPIAGDQRTHGRNCFGLLLLMALPIIRRFLPPPDPRPCFNRCRAFPSPGFHQYFWGCWRSALAFGA